MRRILLSLALGLAASCAHAQTAPSPADVGISKGTPDVFKLKGHDDAWTPFGSVDPSTHIFVPGTNGNIAPNDCVKWGPGLTSAGAACNSVTGGAHPANQLTIYTNHAGLLANVTTPTEAWTIQQQGFYAPGDGGDATYQWNATADCSRTATTATLMVADQIVCILPNGQDVNTPGRYLLVTNGGELDVRTIGMQPGGGFDNAPFIHTLMDAANNGSYVSGGNVPGVPITFPPIPGQLYTMYYFSEPLELSTGSTVDCRNGTRFTPGPVNLVFPPGISGVLQEAGFVSYSWGYGQGDLKNCAIVSLGEGKGNALDGWDHVVNVSGGDIPAHTGFVYPPGCQSFWGGCFPGVGDGVVMFPGYSPGQDGTDFGLLAVANGAYIATADYPGRQFTLASGYVIKMNNAYNSVTFYDLPASQKYTVNTTSGSATVTVTNGPRLIKPADMLWSDAFPFGSTVLENHNAIVGTPTVNTGGSGYVGTSGTMTWGGHGCFAAQSHSPVLNVTASGGVITAVTSVADAGECLQSSPGNTPQWVAGGGLSGGSGASFNMTFNETLVMGDVTLGSGVLASKTETAGQLWVIPAGIVKRAGASTHNNNVTLFPIDLRLDCGALPVLDLGCNVVVDENNGLTNSLVGRLVRGDNSAGAYAIGNVYADNIISDVIDAGSLGTTYYAEGYNSAEDSTATYDFLLFCGAQNYTTVIGAYLSGQPAQNCISQDASGHYSIGVVPHVQSNGALIIGSLYGATFPYISTGSFGGNWTFQGGGGQTVTTTVATAAGTTFLNVPTGGWFYGNHIADRTNPSAIPTGTTILRVGNNQVELTNAIAGSGVAVGDLIDVTGVSGCIQINGGVSADVSGTRVYYSRDCATLPLLFGYDGYRGTWEWQGDQYFTDAGYLGNQAGGVTRVVFPNGILLGIGAMGTERTLDSGINPPTDPWHLAGDTRIDTEPVPGGITAWTNVILFKTTISAPIVGGTTTSIPVAGCPDVAAWGGIPVGTRIVDQNGFYTPINGAQLSRPIGTFAACTGTTLTLQAPAANDVASGNTIAWIQWRASGRIPNDPNGTSWPVATAAYYSDMTPCNPTTMGFGLVYDGEPYASKGYGSVVAGGGGLHRPAFCDGTSWTYH